MGLALSKASKPWRSLSSYYVGLYGVRWQNIGGKTLYLDARDDNCDAIYSGF